MSFKKIIFLFLIFCFAFIIIHSRVDAGAEISDLIEELADENSSVRFEAALEIAEIGSEAKEAVPILIKRLEDEDSDVAWAAGEALKSIGKESVPRLIEELQNKNYEKQIIELLGSIQVEAAEAVNILAEMLNHPDDHFREAAANSLNDIGHPAEQVVPELLMALGDENFRVVNTVEKILNNFLTKKEIEEKLISNLQNQVKTRDLLKTIRAIKEQNISPKKAVNELLELLKLERPDLTPKVLIYLQDNSSRLTNYQSEILISAFKVLNYSESQARKEAISVLGNYGAESDREEEIEEVLIESLSSPEKYIVLSAVGSLRKLNLYDVEIINKLLVIAARKELVFEREVYKFFDNIFGAAESEDILLEKFIEGEQNVKIGALRIMDRKNIYPEEVMNLVTADYYINYPYQLRKQILKFIINKNTQQEREDFDLEEVFFNENKNDLKIKIMEIAQKVNIGTSEAVSFLKTVLREEQNKEIKLKSINLISEFGEEAAETAPILEEYRKSSNSDLRLAAVTALDKMGKIKSDKREHPFLLVNNEMYPELREKAANEPWKSMRSAAIRDVQNVDFPDTGTVDEQARALREVFSKGGLAYILNPDGRQIYLEIIKEGLYKLEDLYQTREHSDDRHRRNVPVGNAVFNSILVLDIIHEVLTENELKEIEQNIEQLVDVLTTRSWRLNPYSVRGTWALYQGDRETLDHYKKLYRKRIENSLSNEGVFRGGPNYAAYRLAGPNEQKYIFMDIMDFTGEDIYYNDPLLENFYEWLFSQAVTPEGQFFPFGDSNPEGGFQPETPGLHRAHHFSESAGRYAAWHDDESIPEPLLTTYILKDRVPEALEPGQDGIYSDGGAWFVDYDKQKPEKWLAGVIWNHKEDFEHTHKDVNSVALAAYGQHILANSGYTGWGQGAEGFSWDYIYNSAVSSNTFMIEEVDHQLKYGGGIIDGFRTEDINFATGDSGAALPNGRHLRDLIYLPSYKEIGGYWIIFDRAFSEKAGVNINLAFHPYHPGINQVTEKSKQEFNWILSRSPNPIDLNFFLVNEPKKVEIKEGLIAAQEESFVGKYLYPTYNTGDNDYRGMATVIFPTAYGYEKPIMKKLNQIDSGILLKHESGFKDYIIESYRENHYDFQDIDGKKLSYEADFIFWRESAEEVSFFFTRMGKSFKFPELGLGFDSQQKVTVYMNLEKERAHIISPGTELTIYQPELSGVQPENEAVNLLESKENSIELYLSEGSHEIILINK